VKKKILLAAIIAGMNSFAYAAEDSTIDVHGRDMSNRKIQIGGGVIIPYRIDSPSGRGATLVAVNAEYFMSPFVSFGAQGSIAVEDKIFADKPMYVAPGFGIYPSPGRVFEPYIRLDAPMLLNNDNDYGARAGLGMMWNTGIVGLGFKYSFDAAYFFQEEALVLNLANVSAVFNF